MTTHDDYHRIVFLAYTQQGGKRRVASGFGMLVQPGQDVVGQQQGGISALRGTGRGAERQKVVDVIRQPFGLGCHAGRLRPAVVDAVQRLRTVGIKAAHALEEEGFRPLQDAHGQNLVVAALAVGALPGREMPSARAESHGRLQAVVHYIIYGVAKAFLKAHMPRVVP